MKQFFALLLFFASSNAVAVSFCQFAQTNCPAGTPADMTCYQQICNGVLSNDLKMFTKNEVEQYQAWLREKIAETPDEICRRFASFGLLNPSEKSEQPYAEKFATCLRLYNRTKK